MNNSESRKTSKAKRKIGEGKEGRSRFKFRKWRKWSKYKLAQSWCKAQANCKYHDFRITRDFQIPFKTVIQPYSSRQLMELEAEFCLHPYLNADRRIQLAKTTSLTERQVKIWFQNRRMKWKREKKGHVGDLDDKIIDDLDNWWLINIFQFIKCDSLFMNQIIRVPFDFQSSGSI